VFVYVCVWVVNLGAWRGWKLAGMLGNVNLWSSWGRGGQRFVAGGGGVDRCAWRGRKLARTRMLGNVNLSDMGQHLAVTFCTYNLYQKQGKGGQGEF
jgi:hypothetical protein